MSAEPSTANLPVVKRALLALEEMQNRLDTVERAKTEPIAIIGMSCRFPGGATSPAAFWDLLKDGNDAIQEIPGERWDIDQFYDPDANAPGKISTRWGGFLDQIDQFDPAFFGISPREAEAMDPQQRLFLEVVWEALDDAGQPSDRLSGSQTSVYVGVCSNDYERLQYSDLEGIGIYTGTGGVPNIIAGRVSYLLNLQGPSMTIDTACSSSLVAVHLACQSLRTGESSMAVAGGVNLLLLPDRFICSSRMQMMATDGRCKTFDVRADGFVRGEGCGAVVLKRLSDALRDGDPILALIRGSAANQDGRSAGLTAPSTLAQQAVIRQALVNAKVEPAQVDYIETHGTGTPLGDPIEVEALTAVYGQSRTDGSVCVLGSGKTNYGHLESAAGISGLIRTVLALKHQAIPPHLHFTSLNPSISLQHTPFQITTELRPWPKGEKRRYAGVSSFGWSGTNVHMVLEEAPEPIKESEPSNEAGAPVLVPLTARSAPALRTLAERYRALLAGPFAPALADLAYTASCRRTRHAHRLSLAGRTPAALVAQLDAFLADTAAPGLATGVAPAVPPKLAFVIPGQGAQWPTMAQRLVQHEPAFAQAFTACAAACQPFLAVSLLDLLHAPALPTAIDQLQPLLFAISVSLAALWRSWGVTPDAVVGHSMGEIAAACIAGALSLEDAAQIVCRRSQLLRTVSGQGAMAVVELSWADTAAAIAPYADQLAIAVSTTARSTVIAGDPTALDAVLAQLDAQQVFTRRVNVDVASHSPQMDPLAPALRQALAGIQPRAGQVPLYSTVEARVLRGAELDTDYWVRNLRAPVQFHQAITQLAADGVTLFVELSPHPLLLQAITTTLLEQGQTGRALPSLRREDDEQLTLRDSLGALVCAGYPLDGHKLWPQGGRVVPLPAYPWQRERFWITPRPVARMNGIHQQTGAHPLLGTRLKLAAQTNCHVWETTLSVATQPLLAEHQVHGLAVLPGAAYLELALAATHAHGESGPATLSEVAFRQMLHVAPDETRVLQLVLQPEAEATAWNVYSRSADADTWTHHASGKLRRSEPLPSPERVDLATLSGSISEDLTLDAHYAGLAAQGLDYGAGFRGVQMIRRSDGEALGRIVRTPLVEQERRSYQLHPALLDAGLQVLTAAMPHDPSSTYLPIGIETVVVHGSLDGLTWSYARLDADPTSPEPTGDVLLLDAAGTVLLELRGLRLRRLALPSHDPIADWLYHLAWLPQALPTPPATATPPAIALVTTQPDAAQPLVAALAVHGVSAALLDATSDPAHLRTQLLALPQPCRHLVVLADARPAESDDPLADALPRWEQLATLLQTLVPLGWRDLPRLWLVTRATQAVTPADQLPHLAAAPLWGLARTLRYEHPELRPTLLDLPASPVPAEAAALAAELLADAPDDQLALRASGRFVARLQRLDLSQTVETSPLQLERESPIRATGSYLITGGLGGLGLTVAQWLVEQGARTLVLLGRRAPSSAAQAVLDQLEAAGVTVRVIAADVADAAALADLLADMQHTLPPLRGIFHAAGVLDDGLFLQQTTARFAQVAAPKLTGAWHLHTLTRHLPLDHFVLFSSGAALLGSPGQSPYAAANAALDTLAHARHAQGLAALSINWGGWQTVGLAAAQANRGERLADRGIGSMTPAQGLAALDRLLRQPHPQVAVLPFNFRQWQHFYPRVAAAPVFADLAQEQQRMSEQRSSQTTVKAALENAEPLQRLAILEAHLSQQIHRVLRIPAGQLDKHAPFGEMGMDSLTALELRNQLEDSLELRFPVTLLWNYQSSAALAAHLLERMGMAVQASAAPPEQASITSEQSAELADILGSLAEFSLEELQQTLATDLATKGSVDV